MLSPGEEAYDYYTMKPGRLPGRDDPEGGPGDYSFYGEGEPDPNKDLWFQFIHTDGGSALLNGQRICTRRFARRQGFPGA